MKPSNTTTSGKTTDMIAGICTFPHLPCPSTKRHVILNLTSAAAAAAATAATALHNAGWSCSVLTTDERIHAPVLHDASQIDYCRY